MIPLYLEEFKDDSLVQSLYKGEITIPDFISSITEDKPYHVVEIYEGKKQVMSKKAMIPLQGRVHPDLIKDIDKHYDTIRGIYPELSIYMDFAKHKIKEGCTTCNKNGFKFNIINAICMLGGVNRELDSFYPIFGRIFTDELKKADTQKGFDINKHLETLMNNFAGNTNNVPIKPTEKPLGSVLAPQPYQSKGGRQSCVQCICKHISSAMIYTQESKLGYPQHIWGAIGDLVHAEGESIDSYPEFANLLRTERIRMMEDSNYSPDYFELIRRALLLNVK